MEQNAPIIDIQNLSIGFGPLIVHKDINLKINPGESLVIMGPSGIGKTLILKTIIGLLIPRSGTVKVLGREVTNLSEQELQELRKEIGMLFQGAALFDSMNVYQNISYGLRERGGYSEEEIETIVAEKLELVGLSGIEDKIPSELSGGQKKRVGLARALASSPKILLFDEPTTGLDPSAIRMIDDLILQLNREHGITCIAVTHDIASAKRIARRWALVNDGTIVADGEVEQLLENNQQVIEFTSGLWLDN